MRPGSYGKTNSLSGEWNILQACIAKCPDWSEFVREPLTANSQNVAICGSRLTKARFVGIGRSIHQGRSSATPPATNGRGTAPTGTADDAEAVNP